MTAPNYVFGWSIAEPSRLFPIVTTESSPSASTSGAKERHLIENAFIRLKDFRRIATRYDGLARNFLASVCLAAALVWWI